MSGRRRTILTLLADARMVRHKCGRCFAEPGIWCRTARGSRAALLHAPRFYAAQATGDLPLTDADLAAELERRPE